MSAKRLQWIFDLIDRVSGPARRIDRALDRVEKATRGVEKATRRTSEIQERAAKSTRRLGDAYQRTGREGGNFFLKLTGWYLGMQAGISVVRGLASSMLQLPYAFAKAGVAAASFKESTMLGLNMMLRDPKKAKALYSEAVNFADISPFETQETLGWYRQLTGALGEKGTVGLGTPGGSRILKILAGLGDVAASQPNPSEAMGRIMLQIGQMMNKPHMLGNDLRPLAEAGVPMNLVYEKLAKKHGISLQEAQSSKWEGKFGSYEGLIALLEASAERYGGGEIGGGMGPASKTTQGLWSTLMSRPYRMMEDLGNTSGFASMKKALENLVNVLDPTTPQGARIKANIELLFDKLLGGVFKRFEDPKAMEEWISSLIDGLGKLVPMMEALGKAVGDVAQGIGKIGTFQRIWSKEGPVTGLIGAVGEYRAAKSGGVQAGETSNLVQRLLELQAKPSLNGFERQELEGVKWRLQQSGFPVNGGGAGNVSKPTGMNLQGGIHIHIDGAQDPRAVGDEVEDRLAVVLERFAIQQGA